MIILGSYSEFSHLCMCPIFKKSQYKSQIRGKWYTSQQFFFYWLERSKVWQKRQEKSCGVLWCIPLLTCLLKTQEWPECNPSTPYSTREDNHHQGQTKTALPLSMGWGDISFLGFLLGPERQFWELLLLPSVPGEATGELEKEKKKKEFRPITSVVQSPCTWGTQRILKTVILSLWDNHALLHPLDKLV